MKRNTKKIRLSVSRGKHTYTQTRKKKNKIKTKKSTRPLGGGHTQKDVGFAAGLATHPQAHTHPTPPPRCIRSMAPTTNHGGYILGALPSPSLSGSGSSTNLRIALSCMSGQGLLRQPLPSIHCPFLRLARHLAFPRRNVAQRTRYWSSS